MLVVVVIVTILVMVSYPVYTSQENNAKRLSDDANMRAARQVASKQYINNEETFRRKKYFDITTETFAENSPLPYGKLSKNKEKVISGVWDITKQKFVF